MTDETPQVQDSESRWTPDEITEVVQKINLGDFNPKLIPYARRREIIEYLSCQGWRKVDMAKFLKQSTQLIDHDLAKIRQARFRDMLAGNVDTVIGRMLHAAEVAIEESKRTKDFVMAWKIEAELFDRLQRVGFVPEAPKEYRVNVVENTDGTLEPGLSPGDTLSDALRRFASRIDACAPKENQGALPG